MRKKKVAVWDLDGTLINSYENIVKSIQEVFNDKKIFFEEKYIYDYVKEKSTYEFILNNANKNKLDFSEIKAKYSEILKKRNKEVKLYNGAKGVLEYIHQKGDINILYTHKGNNCIEILKRLEIYDLFEEIITSDSEIFARKPSPDVINYLKNKHKDSYFCYIGDRIIDVEVAKKSEIDSIFFGNKIQESTYNIDELHKIIKILYKK